MHRIRLLCADWYPSQLGEGPGDRQGRLWRANGSSPARGSARRTPYHTPAGSQLWRACQGAARMLLVSLVCASPLAASPLGAHSARGQLLYVPVYSEMAYGDPRHTLNLSATLTIRNTDRKHPIRLTRVDYYNTAGSLVRAYQSEPRRLGPLAAGDYIVRGADRTGGTASSFLVEWDSADAVSPPLVQAVMIGAAATHGISFSTTAQVLEERQ